MMVRGFSGGMIAHSSGKSNTYYVELWKQPFLWWLLAKVYHWYDMRVEKIPFLHRFEHCLHNRSSDINHIPICARRDIRCYHMSKRGKIVLITLNVDQVLYEKYRSMMV